MSVTIYGASDDLIEVDGDVREEFYALNEAETLLALSCGVVLRVIYTDSGVWRINPIRGAASVEVTLAPEDDEENYSDRALVHGPVEWVVFGSAIAPRPQRSKRDSGARSEAVIP